MIDFVSTRATTDEQTAACARLLAAVIAQAVHDACRPFSPLEKREMCNLDKNANEAIQFLFGAGSVFPLYAALIGSSAETLRAALLRRDRSSVTGPKRGLSDMQRRVLSTRARWAASFPQSAGSNIERALAAAHTDFVAELDAAEGSA